jgi:hypothetical protein
MLPPDDYREIRRGPLKNFGDRLVAGMSDAIIYADAVGVIRLWNRGAMCDFGFTETEALAVHSIRYQRPLGWPAARHSSLAAPAFCGEK